jgi:biotin carboxyl carrier protein
MNNDENFNKLEIDSTNYETRLTRKFLNRKPYEKSDPLKFTAFIPGVIKRLFVHEDSIVNPGTPLLLLEAMKMENTVNSSVIGKVKKIYIREGELVIKNQLLIELE